MKTIIYANEEQPQEWKQALSHRFPALQFLTQNELQPVDYENIECAIVGLTPPDFFEKLPNLQYIISLWAGIDRFHKCVNFPYHLPCFRMIDESLTARMVEYAVLHSLRITLNNKRLENANINQVWDYFVPESAVDKRVGILGAGNIGQAVGRGLSAVGFQISYWSQTAKPNLSAPSYSADEYEKFARGLDGVIIILPNTPQLHNFMNRERLYALPRGAWLINIGRGVHVADADLMAAINDNHISQAVLDVFREEPLPQNHQFYGHERVFLTPHIAGVTLIRTAIDYVGGIIDNIINKQPLPTRGRVDWQKGY